MERVSKERLQRLIEHFSEPVVQRSKTDNDVLSALTELLEWREHEKRRREFMDAMNGE